MNDSVSCIDKNRLFIKVHIFNFFTERKIYDICDYN